MEALAAIGLSANILQFVEFTTRLVSSTSELSHRGSKSEYLELEMIARHLHELGESIISQQVSGNDNVRSSEDRALTELGSQSIQITNELLLVLNSLKLKEHGTKWQSFYQALRTEWKTRDIEALQRRVDRIGQNLSTHLRTSQHHRIYSKLDELTLENRRLDAGRAEAIADLKHKVDTVLADLRDIQSRSEPADLRSSLLQIAEKGIQYSDEQLILETFRFDSIDYRYNSIPSAHAETFSWIFGSQTEENVSLDSFPRWLTSGDDLFWISGKAGSGKSTLMKYLRTHKETRRMLDEWAGGYPLILVDFFFWNAARQSLQKSQQGLLRSMIYQILRQRPDLIRQAFPHADSVQLPSGSSGIKHKALRTSGPPADVHGLLSTLQDLCELLASSDVRLFCLIDGLDEFEGKPTDIIELISILKSVPNVKICVSSRPWNEFEQSFGKDASRKLYMHLLTKHDIRNYIRDTLEHDEDYRNLEDEDDCGTTLINEMIDAAQGVFLWVVLVVRSFREGLTNGDRIVDLQRRLRAFPTDLDEYFQKILLSDVSEFYRSQSAVMFLTTLEAKERLPLMAYWFMDQEDPNYYLSLESRPLSPEQIMIRLNQARKRLNACCKGLLEVSDSQELGIQRSSHRALFLWEVDFLHRTVRDFLLSGRIQALLISWVRHNFNADLTVCHSLLCVLKVAVHCITDVFSVGGFTAFVLDLFFPHALAYNDSRCCETSYLTTTLDHLEGVLSNLERNTYLDILWSLTRRDGDLERDVSAIAFREACDIYGLRLYTEGDPDGHRPAKPHLAAGDSARRANSAFPSLSSKLKKLRFWSKHIPADPPAKPPRG